MSASLVGLRDWIGGLFTRRPTAPPRAATRPVAEPQIAARRGSAGASVTVDIAPDPSLLRQLGVRDAEGWAGALMPACAAYGIASRARLAHFLATVLHESGDLTRLTESLNYSAEGLMRTWPNRFPPEDARRWGRGQGHAADERAIAERAYGGRIGNRAEGSGDGYAFRGRGLIQLTGRANYAAAAKALGVALQDLPAWLETRDGAARSAAWWWRTNGCNDLAEAGDIVALRRRVNGGLLGLEEVRQRHARIVAAMGG